MDQTFRLNENGQQMRFTDEELKLLQAFKDNDRLLKVLRKVFLPEIDPYVPIGQQVDLYLSATDLKTLPPDQGYTLIMTRNGIIGHFENQLVQLKVLANLPEPTTEALEEARAKNSAK